MYFTQISFSTIILVISTKHRPKSLKLERIVFHIIQHVFITRQWKPFAYDIIASGKSYYPKNFQVFLYQRPNPIYFNWIQIQTLVELPLVLLKIIFPCQAQNLCTAALIEGRSNPSREKSILRCWCKSNQDGLNMHGSILELFINQFYLPWAVLCRW